MERIENLIGTDGITKTIEYRCKNLDYWIDLHNKGYDIQSSHLHTWSSGFPHTRGWNYRINPVFPKQKVQ